ncbi:E3 ubiquitin-protein ligase synoviolin, partial [Coelomomyces lativittatus]
ALMNVILFFSFIFAKMLQKTVFGPLRRVEVDHLYERTWLTITEMLLAMTIFRDEFDAKLTIFFALLLFLKGFHWISSDRVDYMEHVTNTTFRTYLRLQSFMIFLLAIDLYLVWYTSMHIIKHGKSVMILFGFEFTMLVFSMVVILIKYGINLYDGRREHAWENKTMWVFYLELVH